MRENAMRLALIALTVLFSGAAYAQQDLSQSGLVGKLENPTIITDPAQWPKKFGEAPALAELVKAGKLPSVDKRISQEPMVIKPLRSVGKYGGTWRRGFLGPGDGENGNRVRSSDKLLFWDVTGTNITPNAAKGWETSADGRRTTLFLRKGMKWSDGAPFTADDFIFWYEDMYQNKDLIKSLAPELSTNGKQGRISKVDETTVLFEFDDPHFLFLSQLAGDTQVGGGQSRLQSDERELGLYAPAHYLKQFLPKYSSGESVNEKAKAAGFDNWAQVFKIKSDWRLNPDVPTISAWKMVQPINGQTWLLERNPYFWAVDTEGNQLPYLDKVHLDPGFNGSDSELKFNFAYRADPEIQKWFANLDFRRALALGIDREQVNEAFFLGLGAPSTPIPADIIKESPGKDYRLRWATLDVAKANAMLDAIGLKKKDAEGFRLRTDNGERLRLQIDVAQTLSPTWPQQAEMIIQQWRAIGIHADMKLYERSLFYTRVRNDQNQIVLWSNNGSESLYLYTIPVLPIDPQSSFGGAAYAQWYASNGAAGIKPTDPELLKGFEMLRSAASQPEQRRVEIAQELWKLLVDQVWSIGIVGLSPAYMGTRVVNERLENVPARTCVSQHCRTPFSGHPEQWYYK